MFPINKGNIYCDPIDSSTLHQFKMALEPSWAVFGALMPDAHLGYSMPIGGVIMTEGMIVPSWVGYDIGCGVCAIPTTYKYEDIAEQSHGIHAEINQAIPKGFTRHEGTSTGFDMSSVKHLTKEAQEIFWARGGDEQFGTLGGGNHFIECCFDKEQRVWFVIHSGSRGAGHGIGGFYMDIVKELTGKEGGNNGLPLGSNLGKAYRNDMNWCLEYALGNRKRMLQLIEGRMYDYQIDGRMDWHNLINKNHNHAEVVGNFVTHRKGATSARLGELGVVPGNMRDGSYIVKGLGNNDSLNSCSHGAGRRMSRGEAKRKITLDEFEEQMEGVTASVTQSRIDESPGAYKELGPVMYQQRDLCETVNRLLPIVNWKG